MGKGMNNKKILMESLSHQYAKGQDEMSKVVVEGTAGNGLVTVLLAADSMKSIKINPVCVDPSDVEALEDLILVAYKNAAGQLKQKMEEISSQFSFPF